MLTNYLKSPMDCDNGGFTLTEVLVALTLLLSVILPLMRSLNFNHNLSTEVRDLYFESVLNNDKCDRAAFIRFFQEK